MAEIRLHPSGKLIFEISGQEETDLLRLGAVREAFVSDWREGLFLLAAETDPARCSPTMRFWRDVAALYLTRLCHIPGAETLATVEEPAWSERAAWVMNAPPMSGGEYLSPELLEDIWGALAQWGAQTATADGGVEAFLRRRAPGWNQVGRVTFHLAENRNDPQRPFAFMASFTTGMGTGGKLKHLPLGKALELYAGAGNKPALIKLLSPVQEAAGRLDWVREMADSGQIYRPMAWTADRAYRMLVCAVTLEESGLSVRLPDWWKKRPRPRVAVTIGQKKGSLLGMKSMLDFNVRVALGDTQLSREELAELLSGENGLVFLKGQWVEVDKEKIVQAIKHWNEVEKSAKKGEISLLEGMRLLAGASSDLRHEALVDEQRDWVHVEAGEAMREVLAHLRDPSRLGEPEISEDLAATLRPYQREGVSWLRFLVRLGLGACLADDMGLGKTLQVLALLASRDPAQRPAPSLLVIPASLLGNWCSEANRFTPQIRILILHPSETDKDQLEAMAPLPGASLSGYDLVITTYSMVHRVPWLAEHPWHLVILDEAQAIKNPSTRQTRTVKKLPARARIALTGTPVENRVGDLWSLFDFLNPGLLGSATLFKGFVKEMEGRTHNPFGPLRRLVAPYILRRLKTDRRIISDLPDKTETIAYCSLTRDQVKCYQQVVEKMKDDLETVDDMARRGLVLQSLLRLKQVCNHPSQFTGDGEYVPDKSGKFARIAQIGEEIAQRQEKALVFTQFREIIPALEEHLARVFGRTGLILHGATHVKERQSLVDRFQEEDGPPFFILSLKAGGTGLNLTAASHVIHFDRWWNPAVENQATDRAFRIGQKKNVLVHKFVTTGTVEEKIDRLIDEKRELAEQLLSGAGEVKLTELADDELLEMVRLDVTRAMEH